jgi:hypothetical protein
MNCLNNAKRSRVRIGMVSNHAMAFYTNILKDGPRSKFRLVTNNMFMYLSSTEFE